MTVRIVGEAVVVVWELWQLVQLAWQGLRTQIQLTTGPP
jgi:hypothetical protein